MYLKDVTCSIVGWYVALSQRL